MSDQNKMTIDKSLFSFGIDLNTRQIVCILIDAEGKIVDRHSIYSEMYMGAESVLKRVYDAIILLMKKHNIDNKNLHGIGVAVPSVEEKSFPQHFTNWQDVDAKEWFVKHTELPIKFVKYGLALAVAEQYLSKNAENKSVLAIDLFDTMISSGFIIENNIFKGINIAHMIIDPTGNMCKCGKNGCLEALCNGEAAVRYYEEFTNKRIGILELKRKAKQNNEHAIKAIDKCANYIAIAISNAISLLSPDVVYIGGDFILDNNLMYERCIEHLSRYCAEPPPVLRPTLGLDSEAYGAALQFIL